MKENKELERKDIAIDPDIQIDEEKESLLHAAIEIWFDGDEKFGTCTAEDEDVWLNFYAQYDIQSDALSLAYVIDRPDGDEYHDYLPTPQEAQLIKEMIAEKIREIYDQTPQEFCESVTKEPTMTFD